MSSSGDGLYDNDQALQVLDDLSFALQLEESVTHFVTGIGLLAWLTPQALATELVKEALEDGQRWLRELPPDARAPLAALLQDPIAATTNRKSRSPELLAILGAANDGPREDALLKFAGGDKVIEELAEQCCSILDRGAADWSEVGILPGELAVLGPLLELRAFGIKPARERVQSWREQFAMAVLTPQKRHGASSRYLENVEKAFALLDP